jgi:hypothetical protein
LTVATVRGERRTEVLTAYLAILHIGSVKITLPQNEIRTLEPVLDLRRSEAGRAVGSVELDEGVWPIFSFSEDLLPLAELADARRVCVLLGQDELAFGIACDKVVSVPAEQVRAVPAPEVLARRDSPIVSLAVHGEEILCMTTTQALAGLLRRRGFLEAPQPPAVPAFDQ